MLSMLKTYHHRTSHYSIAIVILLNLRFILIGICYGGAKGTIRNCSFTVVKKLELVKKS